MSRSSVLKSAALSKPAALCALAGGTKDCLERRLAKQLRRLRNRLSADTLVYLTVTILID